MVGAPIVVAHWRAERFDVSLPVRPHQLSLELPATGLGGHVSNRTPVGDREGRPDNSGVPDRIVSDRDRALAVHVQAIRIEPDGVYGSGAMVQEVPAWHVTARVPAPHEQLTFAGVEAHRLHAALVPAESAEGGEEDRAAAGQDLRIPVAVFALRDVGCGQDRRLAALGGHARQARRAAERRWRVHDRPVGSPAGAAVRPGVDDFLHGPAADADLLHLALREEAQPSGVRREEWMERAVGAGERARLERVQPAHVEPRDAFARGDVGNRPAVRRQSEVVVEDVQLIAEGQRDLESRRNAGRGRRLRPQRPAQDRASDSRVSPVSGGHDERHVHPSSRARFVR